MQQGIYISEDLMIHPKPIGWLHWLQLGTHDELSTTKAIDPAERDQDMVNRYGRLRQEIEASGNYNRWIISSEHLQSRLTTDEEISRLHQLQRPFQRPIVLTSAIQSTPQYHCCRCFASMGRN